LPRGVGPLQRVGRQEQDDRAGAAALGDKESQVGLEGLQVRARHSRGRSLPDVDGRVVDAELDHHHRGPVRQHIFFKPLPGDWSGVSTHASVDNAHVASAALLQLPRQ